MAVVGDRRDSSAHTVESTGVSPPQSIVEDDGRATLRRDQSCTGEPCQEPQLLLCTRAELTEVEGRSIERSTLDRKLVVEGDFEC